MGLEDGFRAGHSGQSRVFRLRVSHLRWHRLSCVCVDVHQGGTEPPHPHPLAECTSKLLTTLVLLPCGSVGATWADMGVLVTALGAHLGGCGGARHSFRVLAGQGWGCWAQL